MIPALLLAVVTATFQPPAPTVGDPVTIEFAAPVKLEPSPAYEVIAAEGKRVVIRSFEPRPFPLSGTTNGVHFRNLMVPMQSVLKPNDDLKPAPLTPPRAVPYPRAPFIAIGVAALLALAAWTLAYLRSRKKAEHVEPLLPADVRFRQKVLALRTNAAHSKRWAALADETRTFLAATRPSLGTELTTHELLRRCNDPVVADILRQGDLEKFSPWGARPMDFDSVALRALELAPERTEVAA